MIAWMLESLLEDMGFEAITLTSNAIEAAAAAGGGTVHFSGGTSGWPGAR